MHKLHIKQHVLFILEKTNKRTMIDTAHSPTIDWQQNNKPSAASGESEINCLILYQNAWHIKGKVNFNFYSNCQSN